MIQQNSAGHFQDIRSRWPTYIPQPKRPILGPGEDAALILVEDRARDHAGMLHGGADLRTRGRIPQPKRLVIGPGEDAALILVEDRARDRVVMSHGGADLPARGRIPQPKRPVPGPGEDAAPI